MRAFQQNRLLFNRRPLFSLLILLILSHFFVSSAEAGIITVYFSDDNVRYTLYTLNDEQAEYVHLDKVAQIFRLSEDIDPVDGRVVLRNDEQTASFFPGQGTVIANRRSYFLDLPPRKINGAIMVPLQFLTDILPLLYEGDVVWDPAKRVLQVGVQNLEISNLYASPYGDYTRLAVEMNQSVSYKVTEKLPALLIFELPRSRFTVSQNPLQVNSRAVQQVKIIDSFGSTQIIVRLGSEFERYTHQVVDNPPRLLIDVYNKVERLVTPTPQAPEGTTPAPEGIKEVDLMQEPWQLVPTMPRKFSLRTIVIDPGHGGSDPGITISPPTADTPGIFEKDITLNIAKLLATNLKQHFGSVRVVLTREGDNFVSGEERTTIANSNRADVFMSLHVNNAPSPALSGFEVYVMDYGSLDLPEGYQEISAQSQLLDYAQAKYVESSKLLAQQIISAYDARNIGRSGVLKSAPLFILKGATMPAVHIELGYCSNDQDRTNIQQEDFQQVLVAAIADGIAAFKKQEEQ